MAGFKETPRQKMIGMMYLVLTALLALNVSKEILEAFVIVNESVEETSMNFAGKVSALHTEFAKQNSLDTHKVGPFFEKSEDAKTYSQDLISYIDSLKHYIVSKTEKIPYDTAKIRTLKEIRGKQMYEEPSRLLLGGELLKNGRGYDLRDKIDEYRTNMLNLVPEEDRENFPMGLRTDGDYRDADKASQDWVQHNFYHTILAADITIFNKLINDVQNAQYDVVSYLYQGITKEDFKFSSITAKILPKSVFIFQGDTYDAEIFVAAVDETSQPTIDYVMGITKWDDNLYNSSTHVTGDSGVVKLTIDTKNMTPKEYTFAGRIGIMKPNNAGVEYKNFSTNFFVAEPSANVAATKMNVFYRGVDNPIKISAAGVPPSQLEYSVVGDGRIVRTKDGLIVNNVTKTSNQSVIVNVYSNNGTEKKKLGEQEFRVKNLPGPDILVRNMTARGSVSRNSLQANPYLLCELPEYVNFEYKYKVVRFTMSIVKNGDNFDKHSTSAYLTEEMKTYIKNVRKNTMLVFTNIQVQGPLGKMPVPNFAIKVN
ncbi:MAG: gliding motility protein GldM [Bacteroidales bacterium]|nr:gliding motility protein GldM [Bacteroidales bacterium]